MPPAAGFVGKLALFRTGVDAGSVALVVLLFVGGALSFVYAFQLYQHEFWRGSRVRPGGADAEATGAPVPASNPVGVRLVSVALALLVLALGLWPEPLLSLSSDAAAVLHGGAP